MLENKNLLLAIVVSLAILFGFQIVYERYFKPPPRPVAQTEQTRPAETSVPPTASKPATGALTPTATGTPSAQTPVIGTAETRAHALAQSPRVHISTPALHGSIALVGGRIDDVTLVRYRETIDPNSPEIVLFSPPGTPDAYFAEVGWVATGTPVALPGPTTLWSADSQELTPSSPVTLSWDNGQGLVFKRIFSLDEDYMFTVRQTVENTGTEPLSLAAYELITRFGNPPTSKFFVLYEGPLGVFNGTLEEVKYEKIREKGVIPMSTTGGWIGITDKYWLSALVPDQQQHVNARFVFQNTNNIDQYQVDFVRPQQTLAPGEQIEAVTRVFAGAKVVRLIDHYQDEYGIDRFDLAIDWGWFYFLTRPMFYALSYIHDLVGNFGVAILLLTVLVKLLFFPLANKSYRAMSNMRKLAPEMQRLKERFGDDRTKLNQEMMALYKREKVNPASGCLPIVIQIPVFFALYKVLFVTIEMRHAPFFGWIHDLSAPDPTTVFNLFGLIPFDVPQFLQIGAWPLIMGVTMFLQQKLNPQPPDPVQAKLFMILPVVFTFMLAHFPAGLVIYWTWNNILSILQQWVIMRRMGVKI